jgi:hypothetical protein
MKNIISLFDKSSTQARKKSSKLLSLGLFVAAMFLFNISWGATYYLTANGKTAVHTAAYWNTDSTATNTSGAGCAPNFTTAGDIFIIPSSRKDAELRTSITMGTATGNISLIIRGILTVKAGKTITLLKSGSGNTTLTVDSWGTIIFIDDANAQILGAGSFVLSSGAFLTTANLNGIIASTGSISTTVDATLNSGARYELNGANTQATTGLPASIAFLTLSSSTKASFANSQTIDSVDLKSTSTLTVGDYDFTVGKFLQVGGSSGAFVISSASGAIVLNGDLTVNPGGSWNNSGNASVTLKGHLNNNSNSFISGTGVYTFNGSAKQNIAGPSVTSLSKMVVANAASVSITASGKITIADYLSVTTGALNNTNGGSLTLLSTATKTARILANTSGSSYITGNVTVQRYIKTFTVNGTTYGNRKYYFVAAPVSRDTTFKSAWQNQIHISGPGTGGTLCADGATTGQPTTNSNGFDATLFNLNTIFTYDDAQSVSANKWTGIANTTDKNLKAGAGYRVLIRGPRSQGCALLKEYPSAASDDVTLSFTGPVMQKDFSYALTEITGAKNKLMFVGNPYPSELSFAKFQATNSAKIYNNYWTYYPKNAAGTYSAYSAGIMTNIGVSGTDSAFNNPGIIASGQSFFIQNSANNANGSLKFQESHKSDTVKYGIFGAQDANPTWNKMVRVTMQDNVTKLNLDEVVVRFGAQVTQSNVYDESWDAYSYNAGDQVLQALKQDLPMAIQTRNQSFTSDTVHLNVQSAGNGNFSLNFSEFDLTKYADIYLLDAYSKTVQKINDNPVYNFEVNTSAAKSQGKDRFTLIFQQIGSKVPGLFPEVTSIGASVITTYPNPVNDVVTVKSSNPIVYIKVLTTMGSAVENLTKEFGAASKTNQVNMNIGNLKAGYYYLQVVDITGAKATKKIIKN